MGSLYGFYLLVLFKAPQLDHIPTVGSTTLLGSSWAGIRFTFVGYRVIQDCYTMVAFMFLFLKPSNRADRKWPAQGWCIQNSLIDTVASYFESQSHWDVINRSIFL
ncbi:hypothetical protein V8B97DRAFT_1432926 [Scleroderma yunnanense]